ncbi:hypothetical protein KDAU_65510 [Dictyobacter aurantiacus]|uniref:Uncharacterized protein n=1 Tax=Dictyobacter aurantiacus TaxID=1936993 RepID=A0A401ZQW5_9CHLR|nr:hypothetical protein KDAU_65510 [Dictyobacter aurantiacus]
MKAYNYIVIYLCCMEIRASYGKHSMILPDLSIILSIIAILIGLLGVGISINEGHYTKHACQEPHS